MDAADPKLIGKSFAVQYYTVLSRNPENLENFYSDNAVYTYGGGESEEGVNAKGPKEIGKLLESHAFQDCEVTLISVDSQNSLNGGVLVSVVGELTDKGDTRKFFQSFFLERINTSFYVLNDVFRYSHSAGDEYEDEGDEDYAEQEEHEDVSSPAATVETHHHTQSHTQTYPTHQVQTNQVQTPTTTQTQTQNQAQVAHNQTPAPAQTQTQPSQSQQQQEKSHPPPPPPTAQPQAQPHAPSQPHPQATAATKNEPAPAKQQIQQAPKETEKASEQKPSSDRKPNATEKNAAPSKPENAPIAPKEPVNKTWATIARPRVVEGTESEKPASQPHAAAHTQPAVKLPRQQPQSQLQSDQFQNRRGSAPVLVEGCSIYASDFPYPEVTSEQLMGVFDKYGKVRNIVLKSTKGYAFIEYDSPASVQSALANMKGNPPTLEGRQLLIEERKPQRNSPVLPRGGRGGDRVDRGGRGGREGGGGRGGREGGALRGSTVRPIHISGGGERGGERERGGEKGAGEKPNRGFQVARPSHERRTDNQQSRETRKSGERGGFRNSPQLSHQAPSKK